MPSCTLHGIGIPLSCYPSSLHEICGEGVLVLVPRPRPRRVGIDKDVVLLNLNTFTTFSSPLGWDSDATQYCLVFLVLDTRCDVMFYSLARCASPVLLSDVLVVLAPGPGGLG